MSSIEPYAQIISNMIQTGATFSEISDSLVQHGAGRGCSAMSIRRFCAQHNIVRRGHVSDSHLELAIANAISEVRITFHCFGS